VSRWSDAQKASEFARIYAQSLAQRYTRAEEVGGPEADNSPRSGESKPNALTGRHTWNTDQGSVVIEERGDTVLISESLDATTTATLEKEVFGQ
jgi:hypothetical protein